ncbi:MAG: nicotinate phosphoribosyltransferase, partial [Nitrososphaera sp.]
MEPEELSLSAGDLGLATDLYELTMAAAYLKSGQSDRRAVFEAFVRKLPRNRSYMVVAGLEQTLHYILNLKFTDKNIAYLKSLATFRNAGEEFFDYLRDFRFTGDVWAAGEGTVLFPNEPFIRVEAPIIEAQVLETYILSMMNFQSLIATKASRIVNAAGRKDVVEFGFRRAHGPQAALLAARASYIGGCAGTSNTLAAYKLGIPAFGTMAHSFVMNFESEMESFREFARVFPEGFLLVDTYDTIAAVESIVRSGMQASGIRLDSGDLYALSTESRKILDRAGYRNARIMASGDLNEQVIEDLVRNGAPIDVFGVGTELTTSRDDPAMNGVYKLVVIKVPADGEKVLYKLKTSPGKKTYPGPKQVYRTLESGTIKSDTVALEDEEPPQGATPLLEKYVEGGRLERSLPSLKDIQSFHRQQVKTLPSEFTDI